MWFRRGSRWLVLGLVFVLSFLLSLYPWTRQGFSQSVEPIVVLLQQGRQRYEVGQLEEAKAILQKVQQQAQATGDSLVLAVALSNLALIAGEQGNWSDANQTIGEGLQVLRGLAATPEQTMVLAQVLNVQGRLQLAQGESNQALQTWQRVATLYRQVGNETGEIQSRLRQSQALQALGLHDRAYTEILAPLQQALQQQPDSPTKAWGLRAVSGAVSIVRNVTEAETIGQESLAVAKRLNNPQEIAASQLHLANLLAAKLRDAPPLKTLRSSEKEQLQRDTDAAIVLYQAVTKTNSPNQLRANLNLLALLLDRNRLPEATQLANALQPYISALPGDRSGIEARLNFGNSWLTLQQLAKTDDREMIIQLFNVTAALAQQANDRRLLASALGHLAKAQAQNQQLDLAQKTTEQAVVMATAANAKEQVYRWMAQLGDLQERQKDVKGAIASYSQAVKVLREVRRDLLAINSETPLLDQGALEPIHRQLVNLLLPQDASQATDEELKQAQEIIESLQLEEINNYLRANCVQAAVEIDKIPVPQKTAIIYPIVLPNRIALITSITGGTASTQPKATQEKGKNSQLYTTMVDQDTVKQVVEDLQDGLRNRISLEYRQPAKQLYEWLIQPIAADLQQQQVETLVFVSDGVFRSIPMAALYDGQQFLIEQYSLATTPGLKLTSPAPLQSQALSGIAFGLTEARTVEIDGRSQSFSELPNVASELQDLQQEIQPAILRLNADFTRQTFQDLLGNTQAPIVHLATHGQFSSNRDQTFLLTSDGVINIDELSDALGINDTRSIPIELLVLSACETATGDDKAPLGLAGIALKSGARSTIASLWKVNDAATSLLMQRFYRELATRKVSKADALRRAQISILEDPQFRRHPYFWAPFILVGNWL